MADEFLDDNDFALGVDDFESEQEYKLHCLKHSTSHIMAAAVQQIFPDVKFGIGPPSKTVSITTWILPRPLTPEDLEEIERRMSQIVKEGFEFQRENWDKEKALEFFGSKDQNLKIELINGIPGDTVSTYKSAILQIYAPARTLVARASANIFKLDFDSRSLLARQREKSRCFNASTARSGRRKTSWKSICTTSKKPKSETIVSSAESLNSLCFTSGRQARRSGCRKARSFTTPFNRR